MLSLTSPISSMKGINTKLAARFGKLGVTTIRDLIYFFPRRHIDYSKGTASLNLRSVWNRQF